LIYQSLNSLRARGKAGEARDVDNVVFLDDEPAVAGGDNHKEVEELVVGRLAEALIEFAEGGHV
jgi:hypothetical protein